MVKKETLTQRAKKLLFANSEACQFCELKMKFECEKMNDYDKNQTKNNRVRFHGRCEVLMELLGNKVAEPIYCDGMWSARKRWAKQHNIEDVYNFDW